MSFGIIRVRKLTSMNSVRNTDIHNFRLYEEKGLKKPENIQAEKWANNTYNFNSKTNVGSEVVIGDIIKNRGIKTRKNSVLALEYIVALSPDCKKIYENGNYCPSGLLSKLTDFVIQKHGKENVISISQHFDESNPHAHIVVIPAVKKEVKFKNRYSEGLKTVTTLAADYFVDGREKLRELQTDFFNYVKNFERVFNMYLPDNEEITFHRGVDSRLKKKTYSMTTKHEIGDLREKLRLAEQEEKRNPIHTKEQSKETFEKMNPFSTKKPKKQDFGMSM